MTDDLVKETQTQEPGHRSWLITYLFVFIIATFAVPVLWFACVFSIENCVEISKVLKIELPSLSEFYISISGSLSIINLTASAVIFFMSRFRRGKLGAIVALIVLCLFIVFNGIGAIAGLIPLGTVGLGTEAGS